jgi:hypothetical protein
MTSSTKLEGTSCALAWTAAIASSALGLGVLHGAPADVARALFFAFVLVGIGVVVRRAVRETEVAPLARLSLRRAAAVRRHAAWIRSTPARRRGPPG